MARGVGVARVSLSNTWLAGRPEFTGRCDDRRISSDPRSAAIDISVVIPAKDEARTIRPLVDEIVVALGANPDATWEVVFIDDGSTDGTWEEIRSVAKDVPEVRGLKLRTNVGKADALSAGLDEARGRVIITMDADMQDDPAELPRMLATMDEGYDLVTGYKVVRKDPLSKRLPSKLFNRATGVVTGLKLNDHNSGLRVGYREIYDQVPLYGELHRYVPALAHANGFKVTEVPVNHRPRTYGHSKYGFERYVRGALDLLTVVSLTRYGRRPSHLLGGLGLVFGLIGTLTLIYLTGVWLFTDHAIGTRPLLQFGVLFDILAVQLLGMGLIAELILNRTDLRRTRITPVTAYVNRLPGEADAA
ncbi:glycosyltransferase family 2 protein [Nocardioides sp. Kera G14]|uniref:glycosyltransferase family 2 protein n=1 Tax=Nocardioides sp. Kera G14 TaxID=2884264 RepID=UPI001D0F833C|nr:glycosyltransferase family 2 protein [Nocardioides sp. Kera G14]UDY24131.1 glycosyltransferase family 2 protein [Nocardioides sp. Kera G14]